MKNGIAPSFASSIPGSSSSSWSISVVASKLSLAANPSQVCEDIRNSYRTKLWVKSTTHQKDNEEPHNKNLETRKINLTIAMHRFIQGGFLFALVHLLQLITWLPKLLSNVVDTNGRKRKIESVKRITWFENCSERANCTACIVPSYGTCIPQRIAAIA